MSLDQQIAEVVRVELTKALAKLVPASNALTPRYLTVEQAGQYICKSPGSIYNMISRREIPVIKTGHRTVRIDVKDLDAWAARHRC